MKRFSFMVFPTFLFTLFCVGCSYKMERNGDISTSPDLAGSTTLSSSENMEIHTTTLIVEAEDWDGVSPIEKNKFYRFNGIEEARKALADQPDAIERFEQQLAEATQRMELREKRQLLLAREITRAEAIEKSQRLLADRPDVLKKVINLLNEAAFPYLPVQKDLSHKAQRKLKIEFKKSHTELVPEEELRDKKKTIGAESELASIWWEIIPLCFQATDLGTNGWTTYPSAVRMLVVTDGYMACQYSGTIKWPFYQEVVVEPEYDLLFYISFDYYYDPGIEVNVDAGLYEMANGVTMMTQCGIRILDWYTYDPITTYSGTDGQDWSYIQKGDCELDDDIDIYDSLKCLSWVQHNPNPSAGNQQHAGDVDDDGDCDIYDYLAILDLL